MADVEEVEATLLKRTRTLITESGKTHMQICIATGLQINWISGVATGRIKDPSVNRIQKLYEYLAGKKLAI